VTAPAIPAVPIAASAGKDKEPTARQVARVAVLGASGYSGQEFVRLTLEHDGVRIAALVSREHAGRPAAELMPGVDARAAALPAPVTPDALPALFEQGAFDTLVACLPHGAWRAYAAEHAAWVSKLARVIDLSSDFRDGSQGYAYGLPEAFREGLADATHIANPGCYPTAATLALLPALERRWLADEISVTALSGVSGAGRAPALRTSFVELDGGAAIYKAGEEHAHVPEMARNFKRLATSGEPAVAFVPHLTPMARGILLTATAPLVREVSPEQAREVYAERYAGETFVQLLDPGVWPETRAVRGSNRCDVTVTTVHGGRTLLATAAIDNLVKGAAGQALQNLNLLLGWPEAWALPVHGSPW
jgi:N-acetyl-gamma-glutamyl-phosphate reductase